VRTPPSAPTLDGLSFVEPVGTGGFADVFLYRQAFPTRQVAVKVLREATDETVLAMFRAEANVMAQLSSHPSIVPIYQAGVSSDGRAFLVMEYCPPPHVGQRFRQEQLPVAEVLEVAVRIASAVETAHRAGILHRDIKPHNILTSSYGAPLLTDFGIASAAGDGPSYGMSIPWSPPEVLAETGAPDVRSDVFSLAATVYSLLAGRSPFEIPGVANDSATLIHRIELQEPARIGRPDVPEALDALLRGAMSKRADDRPSSAMAFARAVQEVQIALRQAPTRLEVMDAGSGAAGETAVVRDARTEVKPISIIIPDAIVERGTMLRPWGAQAPDQRTGLRPQRPVPETARPPRALSDRDDGQPALDGPDRLALPPGIAGPAQVEQPRPVRRGPVVAGVLLLAGIAAAVVLAVRSPEPDLPPDPRSVPDRPVEDAILGGPAAPTDLQVVRRGGRVVVSWTNLSPQDGDRYVVRSGPSLSELTDQRRREQPSLAVRVPEGQQLCVAITLDRDGVGSPPLEDCVVAP
jgi:hypothetical protein